MDVAAQPEKSVEEKVAALARAQLGLITWAQLQHFGMTEHAVRRLVREKHWARVARGVFKVGAGAWTASCADLLAVITAGPGAVLSHHSAARQHRLDIPQESKIHVTIAAGREHSATRGVEVHRTRLLDANEVKRVGALPVTSIGRTIVDLAATLDDDALRAAIDSALRKSRANLNAISSSLKGLRRRHPTAARLRNFLTGYGINDAISASALESLAMGIILEAKVGKPVRHFWEHDLFFCAELDYAWPDELVDLELDGRATHTLRERFAKDRVRDRTLQWMGWRVLRFTWKEATEERQLIIDELRENLRQRQEHPPRFTSVVARVPPADS